MLVRCGISSLNTRPGFIAMATGIPYPKKQKEGAFRQRAKNDKQTDDVANEPGHTLISSL